MQESQTSAWIAIQMCFRKIIMQEFVRYVIHLKHGNQQILIIPLQKLQIVRVATCVINQPGIILDNVPAVTVPMPGFLPVSTIQLLVPRIV
jgi:hypothetical protein